MSEQAKAKKWTRVAVVGKKDNGGYFLVAEEDFSMKKGEFLHVEKPRAYIDNQVAAGKMTEEEATERLERLPKKVVFNVSKPPAR